MTTAPKSDNLALVLLQDKRRSPSKRNKIPWALDLVFYMPQSSHAIQAALDANWKKAIEINCSILTSNPKNIDALNRLGFAYLNSGDSKKAKAAFEKVLKLDNFNPIASKNLSKLSVSITTKSPCKGSKGKSHPISPNVFLEEPGITKTVSLLNIAVKTLLSSLYSGQPVLIIVVGHTAYASIV